MRKPISVHMTPLDVKIYAVPYLLLGTGFLLLSIVSMSWGICILGLIFLVMFLQLFLTVGLPGLPAKRLEIYDEGLIYRTFWRTRTWNWSDIESIKRSRIDSFNHYFVLTDASGTTSQFEPLTNWPDARKEMIEHIQPIIYYKTLRRLQEGKTIRIQYALSFKQDGLFEHDSFVPWQDIGDVRFEGKRIVIDILSSHRGKWQIRFNRYQIENGVIYGKLIRNLWKASKAEAQSSESAPLVIDGVSFNSEGEMIHEKSD